MRTRSSSKQSKHRQSWCCLRLIIKSWLSLKKHRAVNITVKFQDPFVGIDTNSTSSSLKKNSDACLCIFYDTAAAETDTNGSPWQTSLPTASAETLSGARARHLPQDLASDLFFPSCSRLTHHILEFSLSPLTFVYHGGGHGSLKLFYSSSPCPCPFDQLILQHFAHTLS